MDDYDSDELENGDSDAETPVPSPTGPKDWIPHTPGGTPMKHLADASEASAWRNLMRECEGKGFSSSGRGALEGRGFTVRKGSNG